MKISLDQIKAVLRARQIPLKLRGRSWDEKGMLVNELAITLDQEIEVPSYGDEERVAVIGPGEYSISWFSAGSGQIQWHNRGITYVRDRNGNF